MSITSGRKSGGCRDDHYVFNLGNLINYELFKAQLNCDITTKGKEQDCTFHHANVSDRQQSKQFRCAWRVEYNDVLSDV